jgi:Raf kinase inhibitor-like YbhB/YbcL family protein
MQGRTDFGSSGFGGACPPQGDKPHHYIFTLYALKVEKIDVPAGAPAAMIGYMLNANQLAKTSLTALYGR